MKLIITPAKLQYASNDKERTHLYELAAQRVNKYVEPAYIGDDMLRGKEDEIWARGEYDEHYGEVKECGFITNDRFGFTLGYSPDGLVGEDGQIECKSRRQKYQLETIVGKKIPEEYIIQVQTGLIVTERAWCDFISYCGGMHMITKRVHADATIQEAIINAAGMFHEKLDKVLAEYRATVADPAMRLIATERRIEQEMF